MLGPLLAFALLALAPGSYDAIFVVSFCFALVGFSILVLFVQNRTAAPGEEPSVERVSLRAATGLLRNRRLLALTVIAGGFGLVTISDGFLYLGLQRRLDLDPRYLPLLFVGTALVYMILAVPTGWLADRVGRGRVFVGGYAILLLAYALLLLPALGPGELVVYLLLFGVYYAATDGVLMALASSVIPVGAPRQRAGAARHRREPRTPARVGCLRGDLDGLGDADGDRPVRGGPAARAASPPHSLWRGRGTVRIMRKLAFLLVVAGCLAVGGGYLAYAALREDPVSGGAGSCRSACDAREAGHHRAVRRLPERSARTTTTRGSRSPAATAPAARRSPAACASASTSPPAGPLPDADLGRRLAVPRHDPRPRARAPRGGRAARADQPRPRLARRPLRRDDGVRDGPLLPGQGFSTYTTLIDMAAGDEIVATSSPSRSPATARPSPRPTSTSGA